MFIVFYLIITFIYTVSFSCEPDESEQADQVRASVLVPSVQRRASMLEQFARTRHSISGARIQPGEEWEVRQRSFSLGVSRRPSFGTPMALPPQPSLSGLLHTSSLRGQVNQRESDSSLSSLGEEPPLDAPTSGASAAGPGPGNGQSLNRLTIRGRFLSLMRRQRTHRPSAVTLAEPQLWVQDQSVLVLDDHGIEGFLIAEGQTAARFKAILVDCSFSHFTPNQWKQLEEKFKLLNLAEVQEIVLERQPANSRFLGLLNGRGKNLGLLSCLGFAQSILDKDNKKQLNELLKKVSSLRHLAFGKMKDDSGVLELMGRIPSLKKKTKKPQCAIHYSSDGLNGQWFTHLRRLLNAPEHQ